jgi:uncharacterized membrane protein (GlpM family)
MKKTMDIRLLVLYFVIGGLTVVLTTYLGSRGQGLLAAFAGVFPGVTVITFCAIYFQSGTPAVASYARGMLILLPPWILYVLGVIFLVPRLGLAVGLPVSVALYVIPALLIMRFTS